MGSDYYEKMKSENEKYSQYSSYWEEDSNYDDDHLDDEKDRPASADRYLIKQQFDFGANY